MMKIFLVLSLSVSASASCSIKEDRHACPCLLRLDFSSVEENSRSGRLLLSVASDDGFSLSDTLDMTEVGDVHEIRVPRTGVRVNLWSEDAAGFIGENGLVIPLGDDCPPVRMFSSFVATDCETCTEEVSLHKNYCRLTVITDEDDDGEYPFDLGVYGNVDGYDTSGSPRSGEFCHYLVGRPDGSGEASRVIMLPRQTDSSLQLDVSEDASVLKTFALGNYIRQSGYDWTEPDLKDMVVRIDYASTRIVISVGAWEYSYDVDIEF